MLREKINRQEIMTDLSNKFKFFHYMSHIINGSTFKIFLASKLSSLSSIPFVLSDTSLAFISVACNFTLSLNAQVKPEEKNGIELKKKKN